MECQLGCYENRLGSGNGRVVGGGGRGVICRTPGSSYSGHVLHRKSDPHCLSQGLEDQNWDSLDGPEGISDPLCVSAALSY